MMRLLLLLPTVLAVSTSSGFCSSPDFVGSSSTLSFEHTTQIPGDTLKAGAYSISVVEQIADRMIIRIDSSTSTNHAIFLGVPSTVASIGGTAGAVTWPSGVNKTPTLRGFIFPNGNAVEFVYPKTEAAALAKDNSAEVIAVDPKSEGRVALKSLSQDELRIVNLWLLSLTSTGPDNQTPAVLARHYEATRDSQRSTVAVGMAPTHPTEQERSVAIQQSQAVTPPVIQPTPVAVQTPVATSATIAKTSVQQQPTQATRVRVIPSASKNSPEIAKAEQAEIMAPSGQASRRASAVTQLPHTAGFLPVVWAFGLLALFGAGTIRLGSGSAERVED